MRFHIKQNDTRKALKLQLIDANGLPVDLSSATTELVVEGVTNQFAYARPASHLPETGWIFVPLTAFNTSLAGLYKLEVHVTFADGLTETFPSQGTIELQIESRLNV